MVVDVDGSVTGNLSAGCIESDLVARAADLRTQSPMIEMITYGVDESGFGVGLLCGGEIDVLLESVTPDRDEWVDPFLASLDSESDPALVTVIEGQRITHTVIADDGRMSGDCLPDVAAESAWNMLGSLRSADVQMASAVDTNQAVTVVVHRFPVHRPRILAVGANDFSRALAALASPLGFAVYISDPRPAFARDELFPGAAVYCGWPHEHIREIATPDDAVCVLSHDEKIDVQALLAARGAGCRYVGALGSRRTHDDRVRRLTDAGMSPAQIAEIHSPIGLDLGARTPAETALSILAEIVAQARGRSGRPLCTTDGPVRALSATLQLPDQLADLR